jgi:MFS family permease
MSKMAADWFAGRETATAMGIYVNSWPLGIAIALLVMPLAGPAVGVQGAYLIAVAGTIGAAALLVVFYRPPADVVPPGSARAVPAGWPALAVVFAGLVWGLFNGALSLVFSFGNTVLAERGWSLAAAGAATSLVLWLTFVSVAFGGMAADRSGRPGVAVIGSALAFAGLLVAATRTDASLAVFAALGLVCGLGAGPIMAMPTRVLTPTTRAVGMGGFWTIFYGVIVVAPWLGGRAAAGAGSAAAAFDLGALLLVLACAAYGGFVLAARRTRSDAS